MGNPLQYQVNHTNFYNKMILYIRFFIGGGSKTIQVTSDTITILELKQEIQKQIKEYQQYRIDHLYLIYYSTLIKETDHSKTLRDFNIVNKSVITIALKL